MAGRSWSSPSQSRRSTRSSASRRAALAPSSSVRHPPAHTACPGRHWSLSLFLGTLLDSRSAAQAAGYPRIWEVARSGSELGTRQAPCTGGHHPIAWFRRHSRTRGSSTSRVDGRPPAEQRCWALSIFVGLLLEPFAAGGHCRRSCVLQICSTVIIRER